MKMKKKIIVYQLFLEILIEGLSEELAMELITEADLVCPYSKAIKGNVDKEIKLVNK
ncbi:OsmC family protein [Enterococcus hirae]|uniref:hypothetical protein n=1 Tax=Enterococcus hirae TaxID=1354 RepID=UPI00163D7605|nr:hypothetical protein [Enterococcus hirae]